MIENLRMAFANSNILLLTSFFILVLFFIFPYKTFSVNTISRIAASCCLWWIIISFSYAPKGFDYEIYKYNANLTLNGKESFGRTVTEDEGEYGISYKNARYQDYTGAQHLLYVSLQYFDRIIPRVQGFGFQLWNMICASIVILLIVFINFRGAKEEVDAASAWNMLIFTFCPVVPFFIVMNSWEDKLLFLLFPLLIYYLIEIKKYKASSVILGVITTFNGILILFIPVYFVYLYREAKEELAKNIFLFLAGLAVTLLPFFPAGLHGWSNRANRLNDLEPIWYSVYRLFPSGTYSAGLNNILIAAGSFIMLILYLIKKINIKDSLIISVGLLIILSPYCSISRIIPFILLIIFFIPGLKNPGRILASGLLLLYFSLENGYIHTVISNSDIIVFYVPVIVLSALYLIKRVNPRIAVI